MDFHNILIYWYLQNKRELPWRKTKDPYLVWLSEIILQQTRVDPGLDYYLKFSEAFPTIFDLAKAKESTVLKLWQGLGYYSRARNLHFTANYIVNEQNGIFPNSYDTLIQLKGVGDYTASAIASICFDEPTAVVDGNVYRVLARYFGIKTPINSSKGIKQLNDSCIALQKNLVNSLPVKENKIKIKQRYFNYLVLDSNNHTLIQQRITKGIWQSLFEFPLIESNSEMSIHEITESPQIEAYFNDSNISIRLFNDKPIIHKLSHQHLNTKFWIVEAKNLPKKAINWNDFEKQPVPILIHNFVEKYKNDQ
jgi:A/G-specific adenine glycosylase